MIPRFSPNLESRPILALSIVAFCLLLASCSDSSDDQSREENPILEDSVVEAPVVEDPVVEDPVVEDPVVEAPVPSDEIVSPIPIDTRFDDGRADGWTVTGSATGSDTATVSTNGICGLVQVDPNSGFLCSDAASDGGTSYFVAPEKFTGDFNVFSTLNFRLVTNGGSYFNSGFGFDGDISIFNGVSRAFLVFTEDQQPTDVWRTYQIPLNDESAWEVDDGSALSSVLQNVTELRIRAEYGVGADNGGLDDVSLE